MRILGIFCPGARAFFTQAMLWATLPRRLSFSPAWIRITKSGSFAAIFTICVMTGWSSSMSLISSPTKSEPATYGSFATARSTARFCSR